MRKHATITEQNGRHLGSISFIKSSKPAAVGEGATADDPLLIVRRALLTVALKTPEPRSQLDAVASSMLGPNVKAEGSRATMVATKGERDPACL